VEHKDATDDELRMTEINTGVVCIRAARLKEWLSQLKNDNAQGEYYLTDCVELAVRDGVTVKPMNIDDAEQVLGVNSKAELAAAERVYQRRQAKKLLDKGVTLRDPARVDVRGECHVGRDCEIDINVVLHGVVRLGDRVSIGPNCVIKDSVIEDDTTIQANTFIEDSHIGQSCIVGPYSRFRPNTRLAKNARTGNFVEIKNSTLGEGSKANHLAYVGDSTVGKNVNIGAGVITCNYDGVNKHKTNIGDGAFIGTNSALVAPVNIGKDAYIAAGSTINRDAPPGHLSIARARQTTIKGWVPAKRAKKD
jgi:bifunctional UDP-N-acetylglucosamine pyrophosphorylase/glucosamine-1-phosphate N-acetyltransferase